MDINQSRLIYLHESYTQSAISEMTGIPQSTLSYVIRGLRTLPSVYIVPLITTYQRNAYLRLTSSGAPSAQAETIMLSTVQLAREKETFIIKVATELTTGYLMRMAVDDDVEFDQTYIEENWAEAYDNIITSLRNSTKPIDTWKDDYLGNTSWIQ